MAEALNSGRKVHDALAASIMGISYEEFGKRLAAGDKLAKAIRQAAKVANFGFPGGMGVIKLILAQRAQGPDTTSVNGRKYRGLRFCVLVGEETCGDVKITEYRRKPVPPVCAKCVTMVEKLRTTWFAEWPENEVIFKRVTDWVDQGMPTRRGRLKPGQIMQHANERIRGGVDFCSANNGFFQSLAARGAKQALIQVSRECYDSSYRMPDGSRSPLFNTTRPILFAHDEIVSEMDEETAHAAATRQSEVQVAEMRTVTPDVKVEAPPALMFRWYKNAEPVYRNERLVPWEPKEVNV
jgi:DNA polymerase-1